MGSPIHGNASSEEGCYLRAPMTHCPWGGSLHCGESRGRDARLRAATNCAASSEISQAGRRNLVELWTCEWCGSVPQGPAAWRRPKVRFIMISRLGGQYSIGRNGKFASIPWRRSGTCQLSNVAPTRSYRHVGPKRTDHRTFDASTYNRLGHRLQLGDRRIRARGRPIRYL